MDLVVLLDSSSSVGAANFQILREFLTNLTQNYYVGNDGMLMGLTRYNRRINDRWDLNDFSTTAQLEQAISNIPYNGGGTFTGAGLSFLAREKFTAAAGRRVGVPAIALVITDGRANDDVAGPAEALHQVATVIALGIKGAVPAEINTIASPHPDNSYAHIIDDFSQLPDIFSAISAVVCDNNECLTDNGGCSDTCTNTDGSFVCSCNAGYQLNEDGKTCSDIDECLNNNGGCEVLCNNTDGGYVCACPEGQEKLASDGKTCDVDECSVDNGGCSHNCTNTIGSFYCSCPEGQTIVADGVTCDDFNECVDENGGCSHQCVDLSPGYECACPAGMLLGPDMQTCVEINECDNNNGGCEEICENTPGSYNCACPPGFGLRDDGKTCGNVDECQDANGGCQQTCVNTLDGYRCECGQGLELNADLHTCDDINECLINNGECSHNCTNLVPGYECSCPERYDLLEDGSCLDINECENNNGGCQYNCTNTDGSYVCSCPVGQGLHGNGRTCDSLRSYFNCNADVAIVVDSSSSVKYNNFQKMKSFTSSLFQSFKLGDDRVRAALVRYNRRVDQRFGFADTNTKEEVQDGVDAMPYRGGGTLTGQALQHVIDNTLKTENGARDDAQKIVITITDGRSQDDVLTPSRALRAAGVITFGIGIGARVLETQINEIGGDPSRTFSVETFDQLSGLVLNRVREAVC
uniref:Uncharacterized protein n=1 Tax=Ciona intestinalis TaxID=7719 RepID=F6VDQ2_CIOIN